MNGFFFRTFFLFNLISCLFPLFLWHRHILWNFSIVGCELSYRWRLCADITISCEIFHRLWLSRSKVVPSAVICPNRNARSPHYLFCKCQVCSLILFRTHEKQKKILKHHFFNNNATRKCTRAKYNKSISQCRQSKRYSKDDGNTTKHVWLLHFLHFIDYFLQDWNLCDIQIV